MSAVCLLFVTFPFLTPLASRFAQKKDNSIDNAVNETQFGRDWKLDSPDSKNQFFYMMPSQVPVLP